MVRPRLKVGCRAISGLSAGAKFHAPHDDVIQTLSQVLALTFPNPIMVALTDADKREVGQVKGFISHRAPG